jgi:hypothetical protein
VFNIEVCKQYIRAMGKKKVAEKNIELQSINESLVDCGKPWN